MIINRKTKYNDVLNIPESSIGEYAIVHSVIPAGQVIHTANTRTGFFGDKDSPIQYDHDTKWHKLTRNGGVLMSDLPIEQFQHDRELKGIVGPSVLIGGLGLGYAVTALARRTSIKHITVVEISSEVIDLVFKHLRVPRGKVDVVQCDLLEYLDGAQRVKGYSYTSAFYDIWSSDGEGTFHNVVVPLLQKSIGVVENRPINWNENIMRGQLYMALESRMLYVRHPELGRDMNVSLDTLCTPGDVIWTQWYCPFFQWVRDTKPSEGQIDLAMAYYAQHYGEPDFISSIWKRVLNQAA